MAVSLFSPTHADALPWLALAVWAAILVTAPIRKPHWSALSQSFRGSLFLLALVASASMMPVEKLPAHGWHIPLEYAAGFAALLALGGWDPSPSCVKNGQRTSASHQTL